MTPTTLNMVLVEGRHGEGEVIERGAVPLHATSVDGDDDVVARATRQVAEALRGREETPGGHRLHAIGVTCSEDAHDTAAQLVDSLTRCGHPNVTPVRLPEAGEAFARGVGAVLDCDRLVMCALQADHAVAAVVDTRFGEVESRRTDAVDAETRSAWLADLLLLPTWEAAAVLVVGVDTDAVKAGVERRVTIPVHAPSDGELVLARGAAAASAHVSGLDRVVGSRDRRAPRRTFAVGGVLAAASLALVVSGSVTAGLALTAADRHAPVPAPSAPSAVAAPATALVPAAAVGVGPALPEPAQPVDAAVPPVGSDTPAAPVTDPAPVLGDPAPAVAPAPPSAPPAAIAVAPPAAPIAVAPPAAAPPVVPAAPFPPVPALAPVAPVAVPPVPERRPGIWTRIKDRFDIGGGPFAGGGPTN